MRVQKMRSFSLLPRVEKQISPLYSLSIYMCVCVFACMYICIHAVSTYRSLSLSIYLLLRSRLNCHTAVMLSIFASSRQTSEKSCLFVYVVVRTFHLSRHFETLKRKFWASFTIQISKRRNSWQKNTCLCLSRTCVRAVQTRGW